MNIEEKVRHLMAFFLCDHSKMHLAGVFVIGGDWLLLPLHMFFPGDIRFPRRKAKGDVKYTPRLTPTIIQYILSFVRDGNKTNSETLISVSIFSGSSKVTFISL